MLSLHIVGGKIIGTMLVLTNEIKLTLHLLKEELKDTMIITLYERFTPLRTKGC